MILKDDSYSSQGPVGIRAILSRRQYNLIVTDQATLEVPRGAYMTNKSGSRILQFDCEDREISEILCDGLDVSGIPWDEIL